MINIKDYPELNLISWSTHVKQITEEEAFGIYENNWRFVEVEKLTKKEASFIEHLKNKYGNGFLNV